MADLFLSYVHTCPASTPTTAPVTEATIPAGIYVVQKVTIVIAAGHAGLTGIALQYGGGNAIPYSGQAYFSGDDRVIPLQLSNAFPPGVPWGVAMVNLDGLPHSWETDWELNLITTQTTTSNNALAVQDIYGADQLAAQGS